MSLDDFGPADLTILEEDLPELPKTAPAAPAAKPRRVR